MALHYIKTTAKIGFGKEKEEKFVGRRQLADPFTLERLAKEVHHHTSIPQPTCEIVLKYMILAVEDAIQDGRSVELGDLGTLSPAISTKAADSADEVKVVKKRVLFRASKKLRTTVQNMSVKVISETYDDDDEDENENENENENDNDNDNGNQNGNLNGNGDQNENNGGGGSDDGTDES